MRHNGSVKINRYSHKKGTLEIALQSYVFFFKYTKKRCVKANKFAIVKKIHYLCNQIYQTYETLSISFVSDLRPSMRTVGGRLH